LVKLQVFVSSREKELYNERVGVQSILKELDFEPFIFEDDAGARTESSEEVYLEETKKDDIYLGILREEYSEATEKEYLQAKGSNKEIFFYKSTYNILNRSNKLECFIKELQQHHTIGKFDNVKELENLVKRDITKLLVEKFKEKREGKQLANVRFNDIKLVEHYLEKTMPISPGSVKVLNQVASEIMATWNSLKYKIHECSLENNTINFQGEADVWPSKSKVYVRCVDGEISTRDVIHVKNFLDSHNDFKGFVFTYNRISQSARELAEKYPEIKVQTQGEFYRDLIYPEKYISILQEKFDETEISKYYVPLDCYKENIFDENNAQIEKLGDLENYVGLWLEDQSKKHLSILGEFGSGKTWFAIYFAKKCLDKYLENPHTNRLPILISLRDYAKSYSIKQMMTDLLLNEYGFKFQGAFDVFKELNSQGKFLLIFDGFDEMAQKVDYSTVVENFWELSRVAVSNSKVLLTCRTTHFRYSMESQKVLSGRVHIPSYSLPISQPGFEIVNLQELSENKILEVMGKRIGDTEKAKQYWENLKPVYDIPGIANKPVLIPMLIDVMPDIVDEETVDPATIYHTYVENWIERSHKEGRTYLKTKWQTIFFITELAWHMIKTQNLKIFWKDIPNFIHDKLGIESKELDYYAHDLRTNTFLKRDAKGIFEFTHKSMTEFFVAYKFAFELGAINDDYANGISDEHKKQRTIEELNSEFGYTALTPEIILFLKDMIDNVNAIRILFHNAKQQSIGSGFLVSNLITLLLNLKESFDSEDISDTNIPNGEFQNASLTNCKFDRSNMSKSNLESADLSKSSFVQSNLSNSFLIKTNCTEIKGHEINLANSNCRNSNFYNCDLSDSNLTNCNFSGAKIIHSDLSGISAKRSDFRNAVLRESTLEHSKMQGSYFDDANLTDVGFKQSELIGCSFHNSITNNIELTDCNLKYSKFENVNVSKVRFGKSNLQNAFIMESDLSNCKFSGANLSNCNLKKSNLSKTTFENVDLGYALLIDCDLSHAEFVNCNLLMLI